MSIQSFFNAILGNQHTINELTRQEAEEYEHWESGDIESAWDKEERLKEEADRERLDREIKEIEEELEFLESLDSLAKIDLPQSTKR